MSWTVAALACGSGLSIPTDSSQEDPADAAPSASAMRSTVSADPSTIVAGSGIATITVTVRDTAGNPVENAVVTLQGAGTDVALTQPTAVTGPNGIVTGALQSGVAGTKVVSAIINGSVAVAQTAQVNVLVVSASRLELVDGNNQTAPAGTAVPVQPAVRVLNSQGQPVPGYGVSFAVTSGGGSVSPATQTTDAAGIARVAWALGTAGINTLVASATGLQGSPVIFNAVATANGGGGDDNGGGDDDNGGGGGGGGGDNGGGGGDNGGGGDDGGGGDTGGGGGNGGGGDNGGGDTGGGGGNGGGGGDNGGGGDDGGGDTGGGGDGGSGGGDDNGGGGDDGSGGGDDGSGGGDDGSGGGDDGSGGGDDGSGGGDDGSGGGDDGSGGGGDDGSGDGPSEADVARLVFQVGPPSQVSVGQSFRVRVALVDASGNIVPLSGVFVYLGLFREGSDTPSNDFLEGEKFEDTTNGVAEFDIQVQQAGAWRLRALTDDLPSHQPHGPEPYLFSGVFTVQ